MCVCVYSERDYIYVYTVCGTRLFDRALWTYSKSFLAHSWFLYERALRPKVTEVRTHANCRGMCVCVCVCVCVD